MDFEELDIKDKVITISFDKGQEEKDTELIYSGFNDEGDVIKVYAITSSNETLIKLKVKIE